MNEVPPAVDRRKCTPFIGASHLTGWWRTALWPRPTWSLCRLWSCACPLRQTGGGGGPCAGPGRWWPWAPGGRTEESWHLEGLWHDLERAWRRTPSRRVSGIYLWGDRRVIIAATISLLAAFRGENREELSCSAINTSFSYLPDFIVRGTFILELKVCTNLTLGKVVHEYSGKGREIMSIKKK